MPHADPIIAKLYFRNRYLANREAVRAIQKEYYRKNRKKLKAKARAWYAENKEQALAAGKIRNQKWLRENPHKNNARSARGRAARLNATPPWLNNAQRLEILEWYRLGASLGQDVDHIIPLQGDTVCGLHVPWNLQLLPKALNCAKGNRLTTIEGG